MSKTVDLGDEVVCKLTGFKGVVNAKSQWLTGCDRVSVQAPMKKDGTYGDSYWIDEGAVKIVKKQKVTQKSMITKNFKGGPSIRINK